MIKNGAKKQRAHDVTKRQKRRIEKKNAILQTALELFDQYGFNRVTVSEIAEKAHVSKVSIYNFFESKENLRRILIKDIMDESIGRAQELIKKMGISSIKSGSLFK